MINLLGPPVTHADYQLHVRALAPLLHKVPFDDRRDVLNSALARACGRWDPTLSPWSPWIRRVLAGEVSRYFRFYRTAPGPLPDDLPNHARPSQLINRIDLGLLLDHLRPPERRALLAQKGGAVAHRALVRLRHTANRNFLKEVS